MLKNNIFDFKFSDFFLIRLQFIKNLISYEAKIKIKKIVLEILDNFCLNDIFRFFNRNKLIILLFHGISEKNFTFSHRRYFPKLNFTRIIIYLIKKQYKFITLTEWVEIVNINKKIKDRYVILTFDDGFKNVIKQAYPIMKKYGVKGCFYVVSDIIGNDQLLWTDFIEVFVRNYKKSKLEFIFKNQKYEYFLSSEINIKRAYGEIKKKLRTLNYRERITHLKQFNLSNNIKNFENFPEDYLITNWQELRTLDKNILEIGNHTKTHPLLTTLTHKDEFYEELCVSKHKIEEEIGYSIKHLCYPSGSYNKSIIQFASKYGYLTGVTVKNGFNSLETDLFQLKRLNIDNDYMLFKCKLSGLHHFLESKFKLSI